MKRQKGITLNNKNVDPLIREAIKRLEEEVEDLGIGKCEKCGNPAYGWYRNEKLCENCIVKLYNLQSWKKNK